MQLRIVQIFADALSRGSGLAALEVLASGLAHEINNPLSIVLGNLAYALERLGEGELHEVAPALRDAKEATERIARLVRGIDVARAAGRGAPAVSVDGALRRAVQLAAPLVEGRARLLLELGPTGPVTGPEEHLVLAFSHLLAHALEGIPPTATPGACLRVRTAPRGEDVLVELSGCEEPLSELSLCRAIVTSLGGSVEAASERAGDGAVRIVLPGARAPSPPPGGEPG